MCVYVHTSLKLLNKWRCNSVTSAFSIKYESTLYAKVWINKSCRHWPVYCTVSWCPLLNPTRVATEIDWYTKTYPTLSVYTSAYNSDYELSCKKNCHAHLHELLFYVHSFIAILPKLQILKSMYFIQLSSSHRPFYCVYGDLVCRNVTKEHCQNYHKINCHSM